MFADKPRQWWTSAGLFAAAGVLLLWLLSGVAGPLLLAWLLAYLLAPPVTWLGAHGIGRKWAALTVFISGLSGIVLLLILLAPPLVIQTVHFIQALPDAVLHLREQWTPWIHTHLGVDLSDEIRRGSLWLKEQAKEIRPDSLTPWAHWGFSAVSGMLGFILGLFKLMLVPLFAYYLLYDWDRIIQMLQARLPRQGRETVLRLSGEIDGMISLFLRGQFAVCLILAALYSTGLFAARIPFALAIGLFSGLLAFIPYAGLIAGLAAAALMALWTFGVDQHLLLVLIIFAAVHLFGELYLTPRMLGDKLGLHPLVLLLALTIAADRFGFAGMLLAVPVTAAGAVLIREVDGRYRKRQRAMSD